MSHDPYPAFSTLTLTQLGDCVGMTSHQVGGWLKQHGLRLINGEPTEEAIQQGYAVQVTLPGEKKFWAWSKVKTLSFLDRHRDGPATGTHTIPPTPDRLVGPFTKRRSHSDGDGFEIVDANDTVRVWVRGECSAGRVASLLSLADRYGKL